MSTDEAITLEIRLPSLSDVECGIVLQLCRDKADAFPHFSSMVERWVDDELQRRSDLSREASMIPLPTMTGGELAELGPGDVGRCGNEQRDLHHTVAGLLDLGAEEPGGSLGQGPVESTVHGVVGVDFEPVRISLASPRSPPSAAKPRTALIGNGFLSGSPSRSTARTQPQPWPPRRISSDFCWPSWHLMQWRSSTGCTVFAKLKPPSYRGS